MALPLLSNYTALAGAWKLIAYELSPADVHDPTPIIYPHGSDPQGRIMFTEFGYMSAVLNPHNSTGDEPMFIRGGYSGVYHLSQHEGALMVTTDVEIATDHAWEGAQKRHVEMWEKEGKRFMALTPLNLRVGSDGRKLRAKLSWEKIPTEKI